MSEKSSDQGESHVYEKDADGSVSVIERNQLANEQELPISFEGQENAADLQQHAVNVERTDNLVEQLAEKNQNNRVVNDNQNGHHLFEEEENENCELFPEMADINSTDDKVQQEQQLSEVTEKEAIPQQILDKINNVTNENNLESTSYDDANNRKLQGIRQTDKNQLEEIIEEESVIEHGQSINEGDQSLFGVSQTIEREEQHQEEQPSQQQVSQSIEDSQLSYQEAQPQQQQQQQQPQNIPSQIVSQLPQVDQTNFNTPLGQQVSAKAEEGDIKAEDDQISDEDDRFTKVNGENVPVCNPAPFLGSKSLQLTNINDSTKLFFYYFGVKLQRLLLKRANSNLHDLKLNSNNQNLKIRDFTVEEIAVFIALKIAFGLQQNSSNFEFFLLKDLQKVPVYSELFSNERFQFLLDCEKELNRDILSNDLVLSDFSNRAQNAMTADQELALITPARTSDILFNASLYRPSYLCETSSGYIFGYFLQKDSQSYTNSALLQLDNFTGQNHLLYLQSESFIKNYESVSEFLTHKIHLSTYVSADTKQLPGYLASTLENLREHSSQILIDKQVKSQVLLRTEEKGKNEVFVITNGTLKGEKALERHKITIKKTCEKMHQQLVEYRFINIRGEQSVFEDLTEIAILNSFIAYKQAKEKIDYRVFRVRLALELLQKQIQKVNQDGSTDKKPKTVDAEVQTDKLVDKQVPLQDPLIASSPNIQLNNLHNQGNLNNRLLPVDQQLKKDLIPAGHVQKKNDKKGTCLSCLQERNVKTETFISCALCDSRNTNQIFLCELCFDLYHQNESNFKDENCSKDQFSRLSQLKPGFNEMGKSGPKRQPAYRPGFDAGQQQQQFPVPAPVSRARKQFCDDGYQTSGPTFNGPSQLPANINTKRRQDDGFRSDAPGGYLMPQQLPRQRKRLLTDDQGMDYGNPGVAVQPRPLQQPQQFGYPRYPPQQRAPLENGYMTSDAAYSRPYPAYPPQQSLLRK